MSLKYYTKKKHQINKIKIFNSLNYIISKLKYLLIFTFF